MYKEDVVALDVIQAVWEVRIPPNDISKCSPFNQAQQFSIFYRFFVELLVAISDVGKVPREHRPLSLAYHQTL